MVATTKLQCIVLVAVGYMSQMVRLLWCKCNRGLALRW